jgi:plastocyanin
VLRRAVLASLLVGAVACGGGGGSGGDTRTVLVDYSHDEMVTSMVDFFPETVEVHAGDTVRFRQFWTGEAHNVTFGASFNDPLGRIRQRLARLPRPTAAEVEADLAVLDALPVILGGDRGPFVVNQNGAQPCFLDNGRPPTDPDRPCPQRRPPLFTGRHSYYSSGFIRHEGDGANLFTMTLADDIAPGDYNFYCTLHGVGQSGTMTVVPDNEPILSQSELSRQARDDIEQNFAQPLREGLARADTGKFDLAGKTYTAPLAGLATDGIRSWGGLVHQRHLEHRHGSVNQFVPAEIRTRPGEKVTWTFTGRHTVSFNVPDFFPIFDVADSGRVAMNADAYRPVGFPGRPADQPPDKPADVDAGTWDGKGFRSSGLNWQAGDRFSLSFTRPGTYLLACLIHPSMVGKVVVEG